jgi:hypothetical protein
MTRWAAGALAAVVLAAPGAARGNGEDPVHPPATVFERFVLSSCSPCVRESYAVGSLATVPLALARPPRATAGTAARPGEIAVEVVRAHPLGRPGWSSVALRVSLSLSIAAGGATYRLGVGLLDGADVRPLADAVGEMVRQAAASPAEASAESAQVDFHGGTLRVGLLRLRGETIAYVQVGDRQAQIQLPVWEVPTTLYLAVGDLPILAAALEQAAATIEKVRRD